MGKNHILLLFCPLFLSLFAAGQKNGSRFDSLKSFVLLPDAKSIAATTLPFQGILLIDSRFDTSKVGYVKTGRTYKKMITEPTFASGLQAALNKQSQTVPVTSTSQTLLIVVKKFWLQEASPAEQKNYKMAKASSVTNTVATCQASFDVYMVVENSYVPVFRWDTTCMENNLLKKCADRLILQPFNFCIAKIARMDFSKIGEAKVKLDWKEVEQYNKQRLVFPRFKEELVEKGIYKTFDDFLNNRITKEKFVIEYGSQTDEVFVTTSGKPVLLTDYWGLCDGEKNYMHLGFNLFELVKQNNTYDLWGSKLTIDESLRYAPSGAASPGDALVMGLIGSALVNNNKVTNQYKPLQLNMETGEVY